MTKENQVAPEMDKESDQRLNDLKENLIIKDGQLILKDQFLIYSKKSVCYNELSALSYLLYKADMKYF